LEFCLGEPRRGIAAIGITATRLASRVLIGLVQV